MTCLLTHSDGSVLDLDALLEGIDAGASESTYGDGPSAVCGFLLGLQFAHEEPLVTRALMARFIYNATQAARDRGLDIVGEEFEELFPTMVARLLEDATR